jgi:Glycosyl hydrolases family 39
MGIVLSFVGFISVVSSAIAVPVVNVPWNNGTGNTATSLSYGLNAFQAFNPDVAGNPGNAAYKTNIAAMRPGIIRYHNIQMLNDSRQDPYGWVIAPTQSQYQWDVPRISNALDSSYSFRPVVMMNIPGWPAVMDDGTGKLKPQDYDKFADFCVDLLRIVNKDLKKGVKYWEITNEKDGAYGDDMAELGRIYSRVAWAMKQADPTIKVGGPAFTSVYPIDRLDAFLSTAEPSLDFISYHSYTTGSKTDTPKELWDAAAGLGDFTYQIKQSLAKYSKRSLATTSGTGIETFHNEFNISYAPPDQRMTNQIGAIYDALALIAITNSGATSSMAWNESDGWYGKLENQWGSWSRRPASYVYQMFNSHLRGTIVNATSTEPTNVTTYAVKTPTEYSVALVNRSQIDQTVPIFFTGWDTPVSPSDLVTIYAITPEGYITTDSTIAQIGSGHLIPANTVTVITKTR